MTQKYELLDNQTILDGFFQMKRYRLRHSSFHGGWCMEITRERIERLAALHFRGDGRKHDHTRRRTVFGQGTGRDMDMQVLCIKVNIRQCKCQPGSE